MANLTITLADQDKQAISSLLHYNLPEFVKVVDNLAQGIPLDEKYCDHELNGNWKGHRECHIRPDWLLIYKIQNDILVLELSRTGNHSDLF